MLRDARALVRVVVPGAAENSERLQEAKAQQLSALAEPLLSERAEAKLRREQLEEEEGAVLAQLLEVRGPRIVQPPLVCCR